LTLRHLQRPKGQAQAKRLRNGAVGTFVERARTFVERARTHLACVTDASIGKAFPFRTTGAKACGMQGTPVVAAGHTERAWGCNAGLPRSACLAGASRFEALLLNHRRRLPDAIILVNAPHTLLSAQPALGPVRADDRQLAQILFHLNANLMGDKTGLQL